jgi:hypothetical protein
MSRSSLNISEGGYVVYGDRSIPKINAMREAKTLPKVDSLIIPTKGEVLFTTSEEMHDEPTSCYNCLFYNQGTSCSLIGSRPAIRKLIYPKTSELGGKPIEYWPCCSMHTYGTPKNMGGLTVSDPDYIGLIWINAPKVGQEHGGANCGGCEGGDDCDHYQTDGKKEKWESLTGFCRALQTIVACGDVCSLWRDDDILDWRSASKIIEEQDGR